MDALDKQLERGRATVFEATLVRALRLEKGAARDKVSAALIDFADVDETLLLKRV